MKEPKGFVVATERAMIRRPAFFVLLCLVACPNALTGQQKDPAEVETPRITASVVGLRIVKPAPEGAPELRPFTSFPGTTVALALHLHGNGMIFAGLEDKGTSIKRFTDNKKSDLLVEVKDSLARPGRVSGVTLSEGGTSMLLQVHTPNLPAAGADSLAIVGTLHARVAVRTRRVVARKVTLQEGKTFKLGDITYTIAKLAAPSWGRDAVQVDLETRDDDSMVHRIAFASAGEEVESRSMGRRFDGPPGQQVTRRSLFLDERPKVVSVSALLYVKTEVVPVPLKLNCTLGLGTPGSKKTTTP